MMPVFSIYNDTRENSDSGVTYLDGEMDRVHAEGYEFPAPGYTVVLEDRTVLHRANKSQGVRNDPTHLPTKIQWDGPKRQLTDVQYAASSFLVRDNVRDLIERLEPARHQFEPVDLIWKDATSEGAGRYYWFFPVNRLDGMDREQTTHKLHRERTWKKTPDGKFVINLEQVGARHVWIDKRVHGTWVWVSEAFKREMDHALVTGFGYHEMMTV